MSFVRSALTCAIVSSLYTIAPQTAFADTLVFPKTVVTATRLATPVRDVVGDMTVISEETLKTHTGDTVLEVLKYQPGIQFRQNGSIGTTASIFMRGNASQATLVLIDGVRYGSVSAGAAALNLIPADLVSRIEILYGSTATSLYGADAMGGVIQIFTHDGGYNAKSAKLAINAGSQGTYGANAKLHYGGSKLKATLGAGYTKTDGISASNPAAGKYVYEADKDGFETKNASLNISAKLLKNTELSLNSLYSESDTQIDAAKADGTSESNQRNGAASISLETQPLKALKLHFSHGYSLDDSVTPVYKSEYQSVQQQSKFLGSLTLSELGLPNLGIVSLGLEKLKQDLDAPKFKVTKRDIDSLVLGYQLSKDMFDIQASARQDKNSQFGTQKTYSVGLAVEPIYGVRFGSSYATGFRAPTFNDLYSAFSPNPDLLPEESKNLELFASYDDESASARISLYQNDIKNKIALQPPTYKPFNIASAKIKGVNLKANWLFSDTKLGLHYDFTDAKNTGDDTRLPYIPQHNGGVSITYNKAKWTMRSELNLIGSRLEKGSKLRAYPMANFYTAYKVSPFIDVNLRVNNLLDTDYEIVKGYNTLGTNALFGLTLHTK